MVVIVICVSYVALGSPHQCQLLPWPDGHETRRRSNFQLLCHIWRPLHCHLHQLPQGGTGESQGASGTVKCVRVCDSWETKLEEIIHSSGKWSKIPKALQRWCNFFNRVGSWKCFPSSVCSPFSCFLFIWAVKFYKFILNMQHLTWDQLYK